MLVACCSVWYILVVGFFSTYVCPIFHHIPKGHNGKGHNEGFYTITFKLFTITFDNQKLLLKTITTTIIQSWVTVMGLDFHYCLLLTY